MRWAFRADMACSDLLANIVTDLQTLETTLSLKEAMVLVMVLDWSY